MLFNSYEFILAFLPVTFLAYFLLNSWRFGHAATIFLVMASLFFYGWWNPLYLPLILASILVNYWAGRMLGDMEDGAYARKAVFVGAIGFNLLLLGFFKYADFTIGNLNMALGAHVGLLGLTLPLAISFFTFQQIAYVVDSRRRLTQGADFFHYALFVCFFPQLIAGPIVHYSETMPQFARARNRIIDYKNISAGLFIFFIGLFKKSVVADSLSVWAIAGFDTASTLSFFEAWGASLSYTFQLYFDFSGYCDMAIGAALLFNIRLPINFNSPYKATDIRDFWRRWHITLSRFLRDYLYIPLGGNRLGVSREAANIMVVFTLGGLWHGASWTFVVWGAMHGAAMLIHRVWIAAGARMPRTLAWLVTFLFVNTTWVFFRAKDFDAASKVLGGMFGFNGITMPTIFGMKADFFTGMGLETGWWLQPIGNVGGVIMAPVLALCFVVALFARNSLELLADFKPDRTHLVMLLALTASLLVVYRTSEFLYFNF
ncbi:MAG: MBOAT family protein [Nitrospinota bacterium]|nr:MBOAT family protein [Nitrospinota bacterium]